MEEMINAAEENSKALANQFKSITEEMLQTYIRKNHDYGDSFNKSLDKFGLIASVVRMNDKMERIESLMNKEALVKESAMKKSRESYILADSSKFNKTSCVTFGELSEATIITTDTSDNEIKDYTKVVEVNKI